MVELSDCAKQIRGGDSTIQEKSVKKKSYSILEFLKELYNDILE